MSPSCIFLKTFYLKGEVGITEQLNEREFYNEIIFLFPYTG